MPGAGIPGCGRYYFRQRGYAGCGGITDGADSYPGGTARQPASPTRSCFRSRSRSRTASQQGHGRNSGKAPGRKAGHSPHPVTGTTGDALAVGVATGAACDGLAVGVAAGAACDAVAVGAAVGATGAELAVEDATGAAGDALALETGNEVPAGRAVCAAPEPWLVAAMAVDAPPTRARPTMLAITQAPLTRRALPLKFMCFSHPIGLLVVHSHQEIRLADRKVVASRPQPFGRPGRRSLKGPFGKDAGWDAAMRSSSSSRGLAWAGCSMPPTC